MGIHRSFCYALLRSPFRNDQIISRATPNKVDPQNAGSWVIDPVNGESNLVNGKSPFCLSLAYLIDKTPVLGIVVKPGVKGFFMVSALRDNGLEVDGGPFSPPPEPAKIGAVDLNLGSDDPLLPGLPSLLEICPELRISGSPADSLSEVALGRLSFYVCTRPAVWDIAAGLAILNEAQRDTNLGKLDLKGLAENDFLMPLVLAATDKELHNQVITAIQTALARSQSPKILATVGLSGRPA